MSQRILLTGGRAPAALELARLFSRQGHTVVLAESVIFPLTRFSNAVQKYLRVPAARFRPEAYGDALERLVREEQIDVFIPTCEEVFYVSRFRNRLGSCTVWADDFEKLVELHDKWRFIERVRRAGLSAPHTVRAETREELTTLLATFPGETVVLKPVFSRFATRAVLWNRGDTIPWFVQPTVSQPWVLQQCVSGRHLCTYSVAHKGKLLAHTIYPSQQQWGIGSSTVFEHSAHPGALEWVTRFLHDTAFTGQVGFDFIETPDGVLYPIECNPRATSGVHLFDATPALADVFLGAATNSLLTPPEHRLRSVKLALWIRLVRLAAAGELFQGGSETWRLLRASTDVIYDSRDRLPVVGQWVSLAEFLFTSIKKGVGITEVATYDSGYNGIDESHE